MGTALAGAPGVLAVSVLVSAPAAAEEEPDASVFVPAEQAVRQAASAAAPTTAMRRWLFMGFLP